ncbi:creatininase family protein [Streptomyces coelicoflavus]|uniref:creatininase family protein n=1 Tax=Streptomyces TaxID=1883 RepID=UPI003460FF51
MHVGEVETSILLHAAPELIRDDYTEADHGGGSRPPSPRPTERAYTVSGDIGFPSIATPAKGKAVLASLTDSSALHFAALGEQP